MKTFKLECIYPNNNLAEFSPEKAPLVYHFSTGNKQVCVQYTSFGYDVRVLNFIPKFAKSPIKFGQWFPVVPASKDIKLAEFYFNACVLELLRIPFEIGEELDRTKYINVRKSAFYFERGDIYGL